MEKKISQISMGCFIELYLCDNFKGTVYSKYHFHTQIHFKTKAMAKLAAEYIESLVTMQILTGDDKTIERFQLGSVPTGRLKFLSEDLGGCEYTMHHVQKGRCK
jgi:hypothetical protein